MNLQIIPLLLIFLSSHLIASEKLTNKELDNNFDKICNYFQALKKLSKQKTLTHLERNRFIIDKINHELKSDSNAKLAWEAISFATSEQRYELFKSGAESVLNRKWDCDEMKQLAKITGEFE